jgi:hypothetical protein
MSISLTNNSTKTTHSTHAFNIMPFHTKMWAIGGFVVDIVVGVMKTSLV